MGTSGAKDVVRNAAGYGDWLYEGDAFLGKIMEVLDRNHLAENTLLIVTSDNGAEHRAYAPLRESKRSIYEGGHRVPFVARWPGKVQAGSVNDHTVCLNDLMATAAELTGAKIPDNAAEDSVSLLPELLGTAKQGVREATVHQAPSGDIAIRQGPWKAIFHTDGTRELFNIAKDQSETNDVLTANGETAARLTELMQSCIDRGRSTPGEAQKNEFGLELSQSPASKTGKSKKRSKSTGQTDAKP